MTNQPTLTDTEARVLASLRANAEGVITSVDGTKWADVYLDNAVLPSMSVREFDGTLGSLRRKQLYRESAPAFGLVRLTD